MRKIVFALLLSLPLSTAFAQPTYSNLDTVTGLPARYYAPFWYTQCPSFRSDSANFSGRNLTYCNTYGWTPNSVVVSGFRTDSPREILGMVALVDIHPFFSGTHMVDSTAGRAPEYLKLLQGTDSITDGYYDGSCTQPIPPSRLPLHMTMLDSLRWDTVTPIILKLPKFYYADDDTDFLYCYAYECWFTTPVVVDSTFYVLGTYESNNKTYEGLTNYPTSYFFVWEKDNFFCNRCYGISSDISPVYTTSLFPDNYPFFWRHENYGRSVFGLLFPIVDSSHKKRNP